MTPKKPPVGDHTDLADRILRLPRADFVADLGRTVAAAAGRLAPTLDVPARRIGVVADTHCHGDELPAAMLDLLDGCEVVVHCGDVGDPSVLTRLATVAPVVGVRGGADPDVSGGPTDPLGLAGTGARMVAGPLLLRAGRTLVGVAAHLDDHRPDALDHVFGTDVDVALCGTTHRPVVEEGAVLVVNPGSPTAPAPGAPASAALLDLRGGRPVAHILTWEQTS